MKQILQNISNGQTTLVDIPCPKIIKGSLLIATSKSLVSIGTERMLVDFGKANVIGKARQKPEKVKKVAQVQPSMTNRIKADLFGVFFSSLIRSYEESYQSSAHFGSASIQFVEVPYFPYKSLQIPRSSYFSRKIQAGDPP